MKKFLMLVLCAAMIFACASCAKDTSGDGTDTPGTDGEKIMIEMMIKNFGTVKLELYPDIAPITVENFVNLAKDGFYDGLTFHRIFPDFMIQGGDPKGNGSGGSDKKIKGEFAANGVANNISHKRGVISMARSKSYDSASSQFFIVHGDSTFLDGQYAAFGKVVEGMDVIDKVAGVECSYNPLDMGNTTPVDPPVIEYVKVIED